MFNYKSANTTRSILRGIVAIIVGVAIIAIPDLTVNTVIKTLGALLVFDGVINLIVGYFSKVKRTSVFAIVPRGTSNIIVGTILLLFPALMVSMFVFVIGILLVLAGFGQLSAQIGGRSMIGFSWIVVIIATIALAAGVILLVKPFESAETILVVFGVIMTLYGFGEIVWSFKLRKYQKQNPSPQSNIIDAEYEEVE